MAGSWWSLRPDKSFKPEPVRGPGTILVQVRMQMIAKLLLAQTLFGIVGIHALIQISWNKLSTESIDSPKRLTRWIYRYMLFSFFFFLSFFAIAPVTTWKLLEIPAVLSFGRDQPWLVFAFAVPPAALLYYLNRQFLIRVGDPAKVRARDRLIR